jgi:hypothetical protein
MWTARSPPSPLIGVHRHRNGDLIDESPSTAGIRSHRIDWRRPHCTTWPEGEDACPQIATPATEEGEREVRRPSRAGGFKQQGEAAQAGSENTALQSRIF